MARAVVIVSLLLSCWVSIPAYAVLLGEGDGTRNATAPADDPGWNNVGKKNLNTVVYLGNGWILTASHVNAGPTTLGGSTYQVIPNSVVDFAHWTNPPPSNDLELYRVHPQPSLPPVMLAPETTAPAGTEVIMIGHGHDRGDPITVNGINGFRWIPETNPKRWGTNRIYDVTPTSFSTLFDPPGAGTPDECQAAVHDSGGGVFYRDTDGMWVLAGIMQSVGWPSAPLAQCPPPPSPNNNCSFFGQTTRVVKPTPSQRAAILEKVALSECEDGLDDDGDGLTDLQDLGCLNPESTREDPACNDGIDNDSDSFIDLNDAQCFGHGYGVSETGDQDSDGILDTVDNCSLASNSEQIDTDHDGYGNRCDPDFDQNSVVNFSDLAYLKSKFFGTDSLADLNSDGVVNFGDLAILKAYFFLPPGPGTQAP